MPARRSNHGPGPESHFRGDLRRALLDATLEESAVSGPQNISFRGIARRLGVTTAAPYYHFQDKSELLLDLAVEGFSKLLESLRAAEARSRTVSGKVAALTHAFLGFGRGERGYYGIMFYREVAKPQNVSALEGPAAECFNLVCGVIAEANPSISAAKISDRAVAVWSFLHGVLELSRSGLLCNRLAAENEDRLAIEVTRRIVGIQARSSSRP